MEEVKHEWELLPDEHLDKRLAYFNSEASEVDAFMRSKKATIEQAKKAGVEHEQELEGALYGGEFVWMVRAPLEQNQSA